MAKRIEPSDTVDTAIHFLHRLAADGWAVQSIVCGIDSQAPSAKGVKVPIEATVTVRLIPARG